MQPHSPRPDLPDFLLKSTLGIALVAIFLVTPFGIYNLVIGRYELAACNLTLTALCSINALLCYQGKYHLKLNLYAITPSITIACLAALLLLKESGSYWPFLGLVGFYFILPEVPARIINIFYVLLISAAAFVSLDTDAAIRFIVSLLGMSFFIALALKEIYKQHRRLKELSITDPLTNLNNRFLLKNTLVQAIYQYQRTGINMSIVMFDIDHFKEINDHYGHGIGDDVLKSIADIMHDFFRKADDMFRVGGEEFLILLHNTDSSISYDIAEEFRKEIEHSHLLDDRKVTISLGVSTLELGMDWKQWMKECDNRLYEAKSNGRNQVVAN